MVTPVDALLTDLQPAVYEAFAVITSPDETVIVFTQTLLLTIAVPSEVETALKTSIEAPSFSAEVPTMVIEVLAAGTQYDPVIAGVLAIPDDTTALTSADTHWLALNWYSLMESHPAKVKEPNDQADAVTVGEPIKILLTYTFTVFPVTPAPPISTAVAAIGVVSVGDAVTVL